MNEAHEKILPICLLTWLSLAVGCARVRRSCVIDDHLGRHRSRSRSRRAVRARGAGRWRARCGRRSCSATSRAAAASRPWRAPRCRARPPAPPTWMPPTGSSSAHDYVVVGRVSALSRTASSPWTSSWSTCSPARHARPSVTIAGSRTLRNAAHRVSDAVYEKILGIRGAFATRIAYVSVDGAATQAALPAHRRGCRRREPALGPRVSPLPIMSPAWSADGQWLAYVSFERRVSAVYVQRVRTRRAAQVSARAGINGAPAFSPDGKKLALTLSAAAAISTSTCWIWPRRQLTRITDDPGIDTEAVWSRPTAALYFTSDRCRRAADLPAWRSAAPSARKRITFTGSYNARPAPLAGWHAAGDGDARRRRLPHRRAGSGQRHGAACCQGPPGRVAELRAQRRAC